MNANHLGQNISKLLRERGMKPIELAREAGIDRSQLSRILQGKSMPSIESFARIADSLGVSAGYLLDCEAKVSAERAAELQQNPDLQVALRSIQRLDAEDQEKVLSVINQVVSIIDHTQEAAT